MVVTPWTPTPCGGSASVMRGLGESRRDSPDFLPAPAFRSVPDFLPLPVLPALPIVVEHLRGGHARREAELGLELLIAEHRPVAQEVHLLWAVAAQAQRSHDAQGGPDRPGRHLDVPFVYAGRDVPQGQRTITGQIEHPGPALMNPQQQALDHVPVPDEDKRAPRTPDAQYERPLKEGRDLVGGAPAQDGPRPCLLYTSPSPRDGLLSRMPSSA